jgi:hypothetical protein
MILNSIQLFLFAEYYSFVKLLMGCRKKINEFESTGLVKMPISQELVDPVP